MPIKVLFIRIDRIGDMVLSTPVVRAFKKSYPRSQISVLASAANYAIIENNPHIEKMYQFPKPNSLLGRIKLVRKLRRKNYDIVFDLHADYQLATAMIALLVGKKRRFGFKSAGRENLYTDSVGVSPDLDFIDLTGSLLTELAVHQNNKKTEIFISLVEKKKAATWLRSNFKRQRPVLGIHPGAFYDTQKWPEFYHAELIKKLYETGKFNLLLTGSNGDFPAIERIISKCGCEIKTNISNDLREFAGLLKQMEMLICNNSGPLHMAGACEIRTISFMGPSNVKLWKPSGDKNVVLRRDELPCIGCNSSKCLIGTHACMRLISPNDVFEIIEKIYATL